ncbi:MAG: hypothetical protein IJS82_01905 [Paludibacteraceae bacterium]|nr:hypothetical protein [Paludibacteraceae bacterium]
MALPKFLSKLTSSKWDLAFIKEPIEDIVSGKPIHFIPVKNPYSDEYWFADPFILDVTDEYIYVLVEAMPATNHKGVIAKLTIQHDTMTIVKMDVILEEPWHLSFPDIQRRGDKIYILPEAAYSKQLHVYELPNTNDGKLKKVKTICDDIIWDSTITDYFGESLLFTAHQNDFYLDIYRWDKESEMFTLSESIHSDKQNMRMAGALFKVGERIYCPSQISTPYNYGIGVELKEISHIDGEWKLTSIRRINPPKGLLTNGLHTFNTYKGLTIVDSHSYHHLLGLIVNKLVTLKKRCKL